MLDRTVSSCCLQYLSASLSCARVRFISQCSRLKYISHLAEGSLCTYMKSAANSVKQKITNLAPETLFCRSTDTHRLLPELHSGETGRRMSPVGGETSWLPLLGFLRNQENFSVADISLTASSGSGWRSLVYWVEIAWMKSGHLISALLRVTNLQTLQINQIAIQ